MMIFRAVLFVLLVMQGSLGAEPVFEVGRLFSDHMVLQRNQPIRIFGSGPDGAAVTVRLAGNSAGSQVRDGRWMVELPALEAGGPYELEIAGPQRLVFFDVLIGDVWVASGQSNMHMRLRFLPEYKRDSSVFGNPRVRLFKVAVEPAEEPREEVTRDKDFSGGWRAADAAGVGNISAVGYYFADALQRELGVPVGLVHAAQGATSLQAWLDDAALREVAPDSRRLSVLTNPKNPSVFYNGMIAPLQRFPIKGVIWYQGESGAHDPAPYAAIFNRLITRWREQWKQETLPFYWVQLASFAQPMDKSGESWAWIREAQDQTRRLPGTGMAVALDLGEYGDIHPKQKREVAERLVKVALRGEGREVPAEGPRFQRMEIRGASAVVHFLHADGLKARGVVMNQYPKFDPGADPDAFRVPAGTVAGFQLAGPDGEFADAEAVIEGASVVVRSSQVPTPAAVRYAWKNFATANLYNRAGLPAEPFRTDNRPLPDLIVRQAEAARKNLEKGPAPSPNAEDPR